MADEKDQVTRRDAIKTIGVGVGVIATLPVIGAGAQEIHDHSGHAAQAAAPATPRALKFFTSDENRAIIELSERIIPADDNSPGAKAVQVNEYIDFVVSESPEATKKVWREGLAAIEKMSRGKFDKPFADASVGQQVELLTEISKNERSPQNV